MTYSSDLDLPQIKSADACRAIGRPAQWLKNRVSRTPPVVLLTPSERVAVGDRQYLSLSIRSVLHLALVAQLEAYMDTRAAHQCACDFSYLGDLDPVAGEQRREPGQLFDSGRTILFASPTGQAEIVAAQPGKTDFELLVHAGTKGEGLAGGAVLLDLTTFIRGVRHQLGVPL